MQHHAIDHTLTFIHWLFIIIYLLTLTVLTQPPEQYLKAATGGVLINFANFTGKHLCWSLFFTKVQAVRPATLLKKDSYTDVFLGNVRNSEEHLSWRTSERLLLCIDYFTYIGFYNPLQCRFFIFTNNYFFITQLKQYRQFPLKKYFTGRNF